MLIAASLAILACKCVIREALSHPDHSGISLRFYRVALVWATIKDSGLSHYAKTFFTLLRGILLKESLASLTHLISPFRCNLSI
jgi:hypothetical protein